MSISTGTGPASPTSQRRGEGCVLVRHATAGWRGVSHDRSPDFVRGGLDPGAGGGSQVLGIGCVSRPNGHADQVPAQAGVFMAESTVLLARRSSMPIMIWEK